MILNRCVPSKVDVDVVKVYDYYAYLNSFDLHKRVMADFYASYRQVIGLTITALGKSFAICETLSILIRSNQKWFLLLIVTSVVIIVVLRFAPAAVVHVILGIAAIGTTG